MGAFYSLVNNTRCCILILFTSCPIFFIIVQALLTLGKYNTPCMLKHFFRLSAVIISMPAMLHAQSGADAGIIEKIKTEESKNSQVAYIAHNLTDVCGPRLTNSPGYKKAVAWSVAQLKEWGLTAAPEAWGEFGKGWSTERATIAIKKPYYQTIIGYPKAWSGSTSGAITAPVVLLDRLDSATITKMGKTLAGKIVLVKRKFKLKTDAMELERYKDSVLDKLPDSDMIPPGMLSYFIKVIQSEYNTQKYLESMGAAALITPSSTGRNGTVFVDGTPAFAKGYSMELPQLVLSAEDFLKVQRLAEDKTGTELEINVKNNWYTDDLQGYNVVGEIPGSDPALKSEVVMLGGHLDSWHTGTGATDNAAGCIVMMEAVRILKSLGVQPRRTIRIALWGGEEQGLLGSFGYVKKHFGNPADMKLTDEQKLVSAYFNLDNGSGKIRGIYTQGNDSAGVIFRDWLKPFADMGATGVTGSNTGSTDHLSFDAVGIPGFQFIQDALEYETVTHHSNMDVYDHLSIDDLKQAAQVIAAFVYNAAMRDEMIPRKPLPKPERFLFDTDTPL